PFDFSRFLSNLLAVKERGILRALHLLGRMKDNVFTRTPRWQRVRKPRRLNLQLEQLELRWVPNAASNDTLSLAHGRYTEFSPTENDTYDLPSLYDLQIVDQPAHGTVEVLSVMPYFDAVLSYVADNDYYGSDSFTYYFTDTDGDSNTATVNITITDTAP